MNGRTTSAEVKAQIKKRTPAPAKKAPAAAKGSP